MRLNSWLTDELTRSLEIPNRWILFWGIFFLCLNFSYQLFAEEGGGHGEAQSEAHSEKVVIEEKKEVKEEAPSKPLSEFDLKVLEKLEKFKSANFVEYARSILKKEQEIKEIEDKIKRQEEQIKISEKDIIKKSMDLEKKQKEILGCIDKNSKESEKRLTQMVQMVVKMQPQKAADMLSVQEGDLVVKILEKMPIESSSKILNLMDKEISARLQKQFLSMQK